jgi:histone H3/H4
MRIVVAVAVLAISGLLAATLVRMAPGFGMDERMLDARLNAASLQSIQRQGAEQSNILRYYWQYLRQLSHGEFGVSLSSGRPVRDLLGERLGLSLRSTLAGLGLAWVLALAAVTALELSHCRFNEAVAGILAKTLEEFQVPAAEKDEVLAAFAAHKGEVTVAPRDLGEAPAALRRRQGQAASSPAHRRRTRRFLRRPSVRLRRRSVRRVSNARAWCR